MAIQLRSGDYEGFDPSKLMLGEAAVVISGDPNTENGKAFYICYGQGSAERVILSSELTDIYDTIKKGFYYVCSEDEYNVDTGVPTIQDPNSNTLYLVQTGSLWDGWLPVDTGSGINWEHIVVREKHINTDQIDDMLAGEVLSGEQLMTLDALQYFWMELQQELSSTTHVHTVATTTNNGFMSAEDKLNLDKCLAYVETILTQVHDPTDLTVLHADEIWKYDNEWAWLQARIRANNFNGIVLGDYIDVTLTNGWKTRYHVAAIDPYVKSNSDGTFKHHVAMVPSKLITAISATNASALGEIHWTSRSDNNGIVSNEYPEKGAPYVISKVHDWNESIFYSQLLPDEIKSVVLTHTIRVEHRNPYFGSSTPFNHPDSARNLSCHVWAPSEFEVFGEEIYATSPYQHENERQFPYFSKVDNVLYKDNSGFSQAWWTRTPANNSTTGIVAISDEGKATERSVSGYAFPRPCFMIG